MHYYVLLRSTILRFLHLASQWSIYHGRKKHFLKHAVSLVRLYGRWMKYKYGAPVESE
jgi:hypothetical protein